MLGSRTKAATESSADGLSGASLPLFEKQLEPQIDQLFAPLCLALTSTDNLGIRDKINLDVVEVRETLKHNLFLAVVTLERNVEVLDLTSDARDDAGGGVRLTTMHRVRGLEFAHVIIAGANEGTLPLPRVVEAGDEVQERCLLHVASSRARDTLTITSWGRPSPFLSQI